MECLGFLEITAGNVINIVLIDYEDIYLFTRAQAAIPLHDLQIRQSIDAKVFFSFTFFLHVEVAFTADGAGLPVLLRCLPDPLHQLIHLRSRALEATPCLEGRK